jgi:hypothetical protein
LLLSKFNKIFSINYLSDSGHVESGEKGGGTKNDLGGTFFLDNWGIAGEDILTIVSVGGGLVSIRAGSGGFSSSWLKVSAACTFWADITEIIIGTDGLGLSGGNKSSNGDEFHFCFKFIYDNS